ncbi:Uncharacterised protein [Chlamydia trachomatis]|nr:Uncharacterised protein [Chlamydia trachomatis]
MQIQQQVLWKFYDGSNNLSECVQKSFIKGKQKCAMKLVINLFIILCEKDF